MGMFERCPTCGGTMLDGKSVQSDLIQDQYAIIDNLTTELTKVKATIDKLPKTADGISVVPGMELWYNNPLGIIPTPELEDWSDIGGLFDNQLQPFYSTREDAEAATNWNMTMAKIEQVDKLDRTKEVK